MELGITTPDWIFEDPLDAGTLRTITGGAEVVIDKTGGVERIITSVR